jgi:hypothetical protein
MVRRHSAAGVGKRLRSRIEEVVGRRVITTKCAPAGGFTLAERWVVILDDGSTRFVKVADDAQSRHLIRAEAAILSELDGDYGAAFDGFDDHPVKPLLVLEDLTGSFWPPPWRAGDPERVLDALQRVHARTPPDHLEGAEALRPWLDGWPIVAQDPAPFLGLGIVTPGWLERNLDELVGLSSRASLAGDSLVHLDVRSDNLCFIGGRVVFVDWGLAARGNPDADIAFWLPSLHAEGGPAPDDLFDGDPALAVFVAGSFASRAGLAPFRWGAGKIRMVQRAQLATALPWACRAAGLEPPDGVRP